MKPGDRVRLVAPSPILDLASDLGTIVRPDEDVDLGYWIVRLDAPATGRCGDEPVTLDEIVEMDDNLEVLP
jgi:hypothetical protein